MHRLDAPIEVVGVSFSPTMPPSLGTLCLREFPEATPQAIPGQGSRLDAPIEVVGVAFSPTPLPLTLAVLPRPQSVAVVEPKRVTLKLPDFGTPAKPQAPVNPASRRPSA